MVRYWNTWTQNEAIGVPEVALESDITIIMIYVWEIGADEIQGETEWISLLSAVA